MTVQVSVNVARNATGTKLLAKVPPPTFSHATHRSRCLAQLRSKNNSLEKYIYLNGLKERDPSLFYTLLYDNMRESITSLEMVPILYTPTVGDACTNYSHIWRRPEGMYISIGDKGRIREVLSTWPNVREARIAVVTDGSRILGLGDLGANGLPIAVGKLDLYIAGAGVRPSSAVPICLDLGTSTEKYLNDPLYIGVRRPRPLPQEMDEFMDEFMDAMKEVFPNLLVQFEDFSTDNAFKYLSRFRQKYRCFNDDIQGTGAVVLSGFLNAAHLASKASGRPLTEHRILFFGAGSAGIGVAKQLLSFFKFQGMSEAEATKQIWTVDSKGLITTDRPGLQEHKKFFARADYEGPPLTNLVDIINYVKPTALLGLSTLRNAFTKEVVNAMATHNTRPIIFPLSNPVSLSEVDYEDAINWTNGNVIFASGSPYKPISRGEKTFEPGQGNNMYIFPGLGLGTLLAKASRVTDSMVEQASAALASSLNKDERTADLVYPRLDRIRDISAKIALAVIRSAQNASVDGAPQLRHVTDNTLLTHIKEQMWDPRPMKSHF
ncbi:malate dehydrogenase [Lactifluus volemus]|nr:malate dehydrogenase [Lactifluus volemus]